ncbi:MAG: dATP/dGTP diphosphohydrolase domain-containing protein [Bryobacteraceae bacterium]
MAGSKDTNPKDAVGTKKVPISTVPCGPLLEVGLAMLEGARKYGRHNYRAAGVRASVYFDAIIGRHLMPWWEGQDIDPDSGLSHITKAIAGLFVLRDSMLMGNWVDDRPICNKINLAELNAKAAEIIERYPDAKEPFTQQPAGDSAIKPDDPADMLCFSPKKSPTCGECLYGPGSPSISACRDDVSEDEVACGLFTPKGGA